MPTPPTPEIVAAIVDAVERLEKAHGSSMSFVVIGYENKAIDKTSPIGFAFTPQSANNATGACYRALRELINLAICEDNERRLNTGNGPSSAS